MSKESEKLEQQMTDQASKLSVLRNLVEHSGWKILAEIIKEQQDARRGEVLLQPLKSADAIYGQEFMKGEISGLGLAQVTAYVMIEGLDASLRLTREKLERELETEKSRPAAERSRVDDVNWHGGDE